MYKHIVYKSLVLVKVGSAVAKLSLLCTAISTVATLFDTIETDMGWAIDIVCISTYLVARSFSNCGYHKTQHISPVQKQKD